MQGYHSASEVVFHEEALYQVYLPLPLPLQHCFASQVGTGSNSQCLLAVLQMTVVTSSDDVCLNVASGGTSLLTMVGGGVFAVLALGLV